MVEVAKLCTGYPYLMQNRRNNWVWVFLVTAMSLTLRPQRGAVSAFVALPKNGGERCFGRHQAFQSLSLNESRVKRVSFQKFWTALYSSSSSLAAKITYECIFDLLLPEGRCVGLQLADLPDDHPDALVASNIANKDRSTAHWIYDRLHPDEINYGLTLHSDSRRKSFLVGRLAIRQALIDVQQQNLRNLSTISSSSILKDLHGRPKLPRGYLGSISHKGNTGVALVAAIDGDHCHSSPPGIGIGVDIEEATNSAQRRSVARRVLTPREQAVLGRIPGVSAEEEVRLRFSLKETVYKAMHPLICQYVGFQEAEIQPLPDGSANVTLLLKSGAHKKFGSITAHWRRMGEFFLSTASVKLKEDERILTMDNDICDL